MIKFYIFIIQKIMNIKRKVKIKNKNLLVISLIFSIFIMNFNILKAKYISKNTEKKYNVYKNTYVDFSIATGYLNGKANEYVFSNDAKLSQLIWNIDNVYMVGFLSSARIKNKFFINLGYWINANKGNSYMEDYDWMGAKHDKGPWTHWSKSSTKIKKVNEFDVNFSYELFNFKHNSISALVGYKRNTYSWDAIGGDYIYPSGSGKIPNVKVVSYRQEFYTAYLGLNYTVIHNRWKFLVNLEISPYSKGNAYDNHWLRDIDYHEKYENIRYYGINAAIQYHITNNMSVSLFGDYQNYLKTKGDVTVIDNITSKQFYFYDGGGMSNLSYMVGLSLNYNFNLYYYF